MPDTNQIDTADALRDLYGEPGELPAKAISDRLEAHSRRFIELSPMVMVASSDGDGKIDISPRGDAPGFVTVVDDRTLEVPDRKGNNKLDTLRNVAARPHVSLLFMIPGINEVLRIRGSAVISTDPNLCARHAVDGKLPKSVLVFTIEEIFPHCGKAFIRAQLWDPDAKRDRKRDGVPTLGQMALAMAKMDDHSVEDVDANIEVAYKERLY